MSRDVAIRVAGVSKTYRPFPRVLRLFVRNQVHAPVRALDDVSLDVAPGEICAVVGPNGAGKTTLFRILSGLTTPDAGTVEVLGDDIAEGPRRVRSHLGWVSSDDRSVFLRHTCGENLRFHGRLHGMGVQRLQEEVPEVLALVGLDGAAERTAFALSRGQRARLQLARALLPRPAVLVLDEPTGTVDPVAAHGLLQLVREVVMQRSVATLISSHRLEEIEALGSRVVLLDRGRLLFDGDLDALHRRYEHAAVEVAFSSLGPQDAAARLVERAGYVVDRVGDGTLVVELPSDGTVGRILSLLDQELEQVSAVRPRQVGLRDVLVRLYSTPTEEAP